MSNLTPLALLFLAGALVYAAGIACALWARWTPRQTTDAEALTRLDARDETSTVRLNEPRLIDATDYANEQA